MLHCEQFGEHDIIVYSANGKSERVSDFYPYFYDQDKKKIVCNAVSEVKDRRQQYEKTYEADVPYLQRFMIDRIKTPIEKESIRTNFLDIETLMSIDTVNTPEPILSIACYDTTLKKYFTFTWKAVGFREETIKKFEINRQSIEYDNWHVYVCEDEKAMLLKFISFIKTTDPDLITGWNASFDAAYIINRMLKLQINAHELCRFGYANTGKEKDERDKTKFVFNFIKGRIVFDLQNAYKRLTSSFYSSSSLEAVATKELGRGKLKSDKSIAQLWETDVKALLDYNLEDVKLIVELDNKLSIIDYFDEIRRIAGCPWNMLHQNSMIVDTLALRKAKEKGMVLPSNVKREEEDAIKGAYVHTPTPGLYNNIIVFDVRSLYPSIMVSCNLDPFTLSPQGDIDIGNGHKFKSEPEGLLPSIINDLFVLRKKYKAKMKEYKYGTSEYHSYDLKQYSVKVVINSIYGVCGFPKFRLFKREVAESVTYMGREIIKFMAGIAEKEGYKLLYADTDSLFIQSKGGTIEQVAEEAIRLQKTINDSFGEYSKAKGMKNHIFYLEFEKIFSKFYISNAKKRYFGYLCFKDGKEIPEQLVITGFEVKRSDTPKAARRLLEKIYRMLLDGKTQKEIEKYVEEVKRQMQENPRYDEIAIPKSISKSFEAYKNMPIHLRALKYSMDNLGLQYIPGEKVRWAYVFSPAGKPKTDVVGFYTEFPSGFKINWDKMFPLIVDNSLERIYENLGWQKETKQQNLGDWFG